MKKFIISLFLLFSLSPAYAAEENSFIYKLHLLNDTRQIRSLLNSQVWYANRTNFNKFIATYDKNYVSGDGFNLETYSKLVKETWDLYGRIQYDIKINDIDIKEDSAVVNVTETSYAEVPVSEKMDGELKSASKSIYYLKKIDGKWKVTSDSVLTEDTSLLYGEAMDLDIKLTAPKEIPANTEYTASLEFIPPKDSIAIASIAMDKVEYPQKQAKEVFRKLPEDNILERLFVSNSDNVNEYIIASIGLTRADITDLSIKLSLTGFGYQITRVNVTPPQKEDNNVKER